MEYTNSQIRELIAEHIHNAFAQRRFRADHRQTDIVLDGEIRHFLQRSKRNGFDAFHARITGSAVDFLRQRTLAHLPRQRMFTATAANKQYVHFKCLV